MAKNVNSKGRRSEPRHIRLYHSVTGCEAWRDLSGNSIKVLVALLRFDRGGKNGELFMSVRVAAEETGLSENTAWRALRELETHGFIAATERGYFQRKRGPATQWRATWIATTGKAPTRDFEKWQKPVGNKSRSQNLTSTVAKIATDVETFPSTVANIGTVATETSHVSVAAAVANIATQIVCHGQSVSGGIEGQRKQANISRDVSRDLVGDELLVALRERLAAHLQASGMGAQSRLAEATRIPGGTLSKFIAGKGLNRTHFVSLQLELNRLNRSAA
jgi:DNA-binding Lrp family transcriptional regulator